MGSHLSAVGFSKVKKRTEWDELITQVIEDPTERYVTSEHDEEAYIEHFKSYGPDFGLVVRGTLDEEDEVVVDTCDPYIDAKHVMDVSEVEIEKTEDDSTYYAICEEEETGTEIIFYLQNVIEYLDIDNLQDVSIQGVRVVGLAVQGTVILPVEKDDVDKVIEEEQDAWYKELIKRAREGDDEAEELLDLQAEETSQLIRERLKKEDFLSVVEGYFLPDEKQDATYSILGFIREIHRSINQDTKEEIYRMYLDTMGMGIEVCINQKDLIGIPSIGMRFMGICWIQGKVVFA